MTDHDDVAQRAYHQPDPDRIQIREDGEDGDGLFRLRMPISSTLEARDGDAFDRDRLDGWATQINEGTVPVYGDHGQNLDIAGSRYSAFGKLGYYDDAEVREIDDMDGEHELVTDTVLMDPDSLGEETGTLREQLARLKAQTDRDIPITQSVGWNDDVGSRDVPGGSDLLEGSIVGIPSDGHASSHNVAVEMARTAVDADGDRDPEQLVEDFRAVVMGSDSDDRDSTEMTDDPDSPDTESGDGRDETDGISAEEFRDQMLEMQRNQTETLNTLSEALREDDEDDDDDDDDEDGDEDEGENAADTEGTGERSVTIDGEEMSADDALDELRNAADDVDPADSETETRAETPTDEEGDEDDVEQRDEPDETDSEPTFSFN